MAAIKFENSEEFLKIQELKILKPCRVKEEGSRTARACAVGDTVKVSGNDKAQLLYTGMAEIKTADKGSK